MQDKAEKNWVVTDLKQKHRFFYHNEKDAFKKVQDLNENDTHSEMKEYTKDISATAVYDRKTHLIRDLDKSKPIESNPQKFIMLQPYDSDYDLLPGLTFSV